MKNYVEHNTAYIKAIDAHDYERRYRDVARFEDLCRQCPNYGRRWACPPIDAGDMPALSQYSRLMLLMVKLDLKPGTPGDADTLRSIIETARADFERRLLKAEKDLGGAACLFTGMCPHCPGQECARTLGKPCRHPELVRPSLEALGFDLEATAREVFGIPMLWCDKGMAPPYLTLIAGVFHNNDDSKYIIE